MNSTWTSQQLFDNTVSLRQSVMSKEDEYSRYERDLLMEINELRRDPVAYSFVLEAEATAGYPFVRDDPLPEECSEMTLEQLRVYIEDFQAERRELSKAVARMRKEWAEADAGMKERWGHEDAERAKKAKRGAGRKHRGSVIREEDFAVQRERSALELHVRYTQQIEEANARMLHLERSCRSAIEGANVIIKCVRHLRGLSAMPELEYSRSLTLAARDVGNECHRKAFAEMDPTPSQPRERGSSKSSTAAVDTPAPPPPPEADTPAPPPPPEADAPAPAMLCDTRKRASNDTVDAASQMDDGNALHATLVDLFNASSPQSLPTAVASSHGLAGEGELLKMATMKACDRYGYCSGVVRGVQLCKAFAPRKILIQMLLALRVPQFTVLPPNATLDMCDSLTSPSSPILWSGGRLLGIGLVLAPDGVVSVTILIATSFEELSVIHERHDFSLPQIHRILNSRTGTHTSGGSRPAVVLIRSALGVRVVEPAAHPVFLDQGQRVMRLAVRADPNLVQLTATVTAVADPIPSVPLLDGQLLLVQHSRDDVGEVEMLLDVRVAYRRWSDQALLVHLFERNRSADVVSSFVNIGFVRVILAGQPGGFVAEATQSAFLPIKKTHFRRQEEGADAAIIRVPPVLAQRRCKYLNVINEEPYGWPLVTSHFHEYCATIIEPLSGTWVLFGDTQRIVIKISHSDYLNAHLDNVHTLLEQEKAYLKWEETNESRQRAADLIASTSIELKQAEETFRERADPIQQELAQLRKTMARRRGKELAKLKKQEEELQHSLDELKMNIKDLHFTLSDAEEELVLIGRDHALRSNRRKRLEQEYEQLRARVSRAVPLRVEVLLLEHDGEVCVTRERLMLHPIDATGVVYSGDVHPPKGFKGRVVLFVDDQEAVRWEVLPGH